MDRFLSLLPVVNSQGSFPLEKATVRGKAGTRRTIPVSSMTTTTVETLPQRDQHRVVSISGSRGHKSVASCVGTSVRVRSGAVTVDDWAS